MNADTVKRLGFDVIAPLVKEIAEKSGLKRNEPNNSFLDGCYECEWTLPIIPKDRMGTFTTPLR